jgi:hypothetical protein
MDSFIIIARHNSMLSLDSQIRKMSLSKKTQSEAMQYVTFGGVFSLLNGAGTSLCRSVSAMSNISLTALATFLAGQAKQCSKHIRSQYKENPKGVKVWVSTR